MKLSVLRLKGAHIREREGLGITMPSFIKADDGWDLEVGHNGVVAVNPYGVAQWIPITSCAGGDVLSAVDLEGKPLNLSPGAMRKRLLRDAQGSGS